MNPDGSLFRTSDALGSSSLFGVPIGPYTGPLHEQVGGSGFKINPLANATATTQSLGFNNPDAQLTIPMTRYSAFARGHYDITDNITAFAEANYSHTFTSAVSLIPPAFNFWALSVPYNAANDDPDSPTFGSDPSTWHPVSAPLADLLNARGPTGGTTPWVLTRSLDFLGRLRTDTTSNIFQFTAGLEGELGVRDWTWEVYGSHGQTDVNASQPEGQISQENIQQILNGTSTGFANGVTFPGPVSSTGIFNGQAVGWSAGWSNGPGGTDQTATVGQCTSGIPLFNPDGSVPARVTVTDDCKEYVTLETNSVTTLEQNIVEASMQGSLFDLPAGELRFALGAHYRDVSFSFVPDSGLSANQERANVINIISLPRTSTGEVSVQEAFGELLVPVISDVPLIQQLELELGARYSDYSTTGGEETYKALADWQVVDWLRFRGGYQLATRSPNVYELFTPLATSPDFSPLDDPCTNIPGFTADYGNVAVEPGVNDNNVTNTRENLQLACAELIARDGGFQYRTVLDDINDGLPAINWGQPAADIGQPGFDTTHISNFRWTVPGYNIPFPITLALVTGNPDLQSEEAETWTLGGVLNSPFDSPLLDQLTLSVDWYSIELTNTISTLPNTLVYEQCLSPEFNPLMADAPGTHTGAELLAGNAFCDQLKREPVDFAGVPGAVGSGLSRNYDAQFTNLGGTNTAGVDVQVNWGVDFADVGLQAVPGSLRVNFIANFLEKFEESPYEGAAFVDYTGTLDGNGRYDYKTFTTVSWLLDNWSLGARTRYLPEIDPSPNAATGVIGTASHTEFDVFGRWQVNDTFELRGGVDNVADEQPEIVGATPFNNAVGSTNPGNYDVLGRRFFVGATLRY